MESNDKKCPFRKGFIEEKNEMTFKSYEEKFLPCLRIECMAYNKTTKECLLCRRNPNIGEKQALPWF